MEVIAIGNQKGGSGKTTLTVNLAAGLSRAGKRVAVLDLDPQGGASAWCGFNQEISEHDYGTPLLEAITTGEPSLVDLLQSTSSGFSIVPNSTEFSAFDIASRAELAHENLLKTCLRGLPTGELDFVLLDTPPNIGPILTNALTAANGFVLAVEAQASNIDPARRAYELAKQVGSALNEDLECVGVVLGLFDPRRLQDRDMYAELREQYGDLLFDQTIRWSTRFGEAFSREQTIQEYDPDGIGSSDFAALTTQFLLSLGSPEKDITHA